MPWTKKEKVFCVTTYLGTKIIEKCFKIDATHQYDDLLLRKVTKKRLNVYEVYMITNKKKQH